MSISTITLPVSMGALILKSLQRASFANSDDRISARLGGAAIELELTHAASIASAKPVASDEANDNHIPLSHYNGWGALPSSLKTHSTPLGYISAYGLGKLQTRNHYCISVSRQAEKEYVIPIFGDREDG